MHHPNLIAPAQARAVTAGIAALFLASGMAWTCIPAAGASIGTLSVPATAATPDPLQIRRDILADPEIQQRATPGVPQLPDLPNIDLSFLRWVLIAAGAMGAIALLVLLGPILFRFFVAARLRRGPAADLAEAEVKTSIQAMQRAQAATAIQDYRLALRMLYLASLLKLDEIGALRYDRALTNREYVREVALKPSLASALWPVVETFDDAWYGGRPVTPEGYSAFASNVSKLLQAAETEKSR